LGWGDLTSALGVGMHAGRSLDLAALRIAAIEAPPGTVELVRPLVAAIAAATAVALPDPDVSRLVMLYTAARPVFDPSHVRFTADELARTLVPISRRVNLPSGIAIPRSPSGPLPLASMSAPPSPVVAGTSPTLPPRSPSPPPALPSPTQPVPVAPSSLPALAPAAPSSAPAIPTILSPSVRLLNPLPDDAPMRSYPLYVPRQIYRYIQRSPAITDVRPGTSDPPVCRTVTWPDDPDRPQLTVYF
jgi:hypothetical protein